MPQVGGNITLQVNGQVYNAKGNFTYNLGKPKQEGVVGADRTHGFKQTPQLCYIEGEITDRGDFALVDLVTIKDASVTLSLGNGKVIILRNAWYAADGQANTDEGNVQFRMEGMSAEEVR